MTQKSKRRDPFTSQNQSQNHEIQLKNYALKKSRQTVISYSKFKKPDPALGPNAKTMKKLDSSQFKNVLMSGINLKFPFVPYPSQLQVMSKLLRCLKDSTNGIFESPTGTGKTLSILVSAISWQNNEKKAIAALNAAVKKKQDASSDTRNPIDPLRSHPNDFPSSLNSNNSLPSSFSIRAPKIFIASRTHRQLEQMILEMKNKTDLVPKMAILGSREQLCIDPETSAKPNKNEECSKKIEFQSCFFFENSKILASFKRSQKEIFDIEDLVKDGKDMGACPYYAAKTLCENAEVIFTPYNYVIDPQSSPAEVSLAGNILIIDEAHNIESCATEAASIQIKEGELHFAMTDLQTFGIATKSNTDDLKLVLSWFSQWINNHMHDQLSVEELDKFIKLWSGQEAAKMITDGGIEGNLIIKCKIDFEKFSSGTSSSFKGDDAKLKASTKNIISKLLMVLEFIVVNGYQSDYKMVLTKTKARQNREDSTVIGPELGIEFWCLNSGVIFKELGKKCRSLILTSGTLSPLSSYALELGIPFAQTVEAHHVIGRHQLWAGIVPSSLSGENLSCTFTNLSRTDFQIQLGLTIIELIKVIPNGCLVFLPSYTWMDRLIEKWKSVGRVWSEMKKYKTIFVEPSSKKSGSINLEKLISQYDEAAQSDFGALMFCVYRGKMSEGIDFANEKARGVICVGIPYPNVKSPKLLETKNYHNMYSKEKNLMDGDTWYKTQAFRALNQALGRCIRHQNDFGAVILLDSRFKTQPETQKLLPKWFGKFLTTHHALDQVSHSIASFFGNILELEKIRIAKEKDEGLSSDSNHEDHDLSQLKSSYQEKERGEKVKTLQQGVTENAPSLEERVPSIQDEQSPPSDPGLNSLMDQSEILVPESPLDEDLVDIVKNNGSDTFRWTCSQCGTHLITSRLAFIENGPKYPQTLLQEGELCDLGQFDVGVLKQESGCVLTSNDHAVEQDGILYLSVTCKYCENMVGLYLNGQSTNTLKEYQDLIFHLVFFSNKTAFDLCDSVPEEYSESPRLDYRSYSDEYSPIDLAALEKLE